MVFVFQTGYHLSLLRCYFIDCQFRFENIITVGIVISSEIDMQISGSHAFNHTFINVQYMGRATLISPIEISCMVLLKLKLNAENFSGTPISKVVITVPAYFSIVQRKATKIAATLAGLEAVHAISEPSAAATLATYIWQVYIRF